MNDVEEWKWIVGYESTYQVSSFGRIKSVERMVPHKRSVLKSIRHKILAFSNSRGYLAVSLFRDGKKKTILVHRIVAKHFVENPNNLPEVNHKDLDKRNNKASNLEWCTERENTYHAINNGVRPSSRLTPEKAELILANIGKMTSKQMCVKFDVSSWGVQSVRSGRYKPI